MARRHPVTARIDAAIAQLERLGVDVTPAAVKINVKKHLTYADFSSDEAMDAILDARIRPRLKAKGYIIVDDDTGQRQLFETSTIEQIDEQIRIEQRNVTFAENRLRARKAIREFLAAKQATANRPVTPSDFMVDIEAIYAAHGFGDVEDQREAA